MKNLLFLAVLSAAIFACKPKQIAPNIENNYSKFQKISLDYGDSVLYFHIAEENEIEPSFEETYTWFRRDTVMTTQGQFSGRLLHGAFELLKRTDRSLIKKGSYDQGRPDGEWITWYPNGTIKHAFTYKAGEKEGAFLKQDEKGKPVMKGEYKANLLDGTCEHYQADTLAYRIKYNKGIPTDTLP